MAEKPANGKGRPKHSANSGWHHDVMRAASAGVGEVAGGLLNERENGIERTDSCSSLESDVDLEVVAHDTAGKSRGRTTCSHNNKGGNENLRKKLDSTIEARTKSPAGSASCAGNASERVAVGTPAMGQSNQSNNDLIQSLYEHGGSRNANCALDPPFAVGNSNSASRLATLIKLEDALRSDQLEVQLDATKQIRQLLSAERDTHVQTVLDRDVVPQLLKFLRDKDNAALQVEALWALTNIAAGTTEHTHLLIKNNAVPTLVGLLDSTHSKVLEQAVWVLGNIAGDSHHTARDTVLSCGALEPLLKCMKDTKEVTLLRIATWTLSNLCDGQPRPVLDVISVLDTLRVVLDETDTEVLSHACWALSHLCDGPSPHIQAVVQANVCGRLVSLLRNKSWRVVKPALRTVGNIVCAEDEQDYTQRIIECGAVPYLRALVANSNREIQKEACWTLSNIAAGTVDQIQCVLDSGAIPPLVALAQENSDTDPDVKIEACWVLLNATSCGSDSQIQSLVEYGCVTVLCNLLEDSSMLLMALEGLEKILQVGDEIAARSQGQSINPHAALLDTTKVKALQNHRSSAIAKRATAMWKMYFVLCAICNKAYSFNSPETTFCNECKCAVCRHCDCSVYHLSYQDKLWRDLAEGEAQKEKSKQKSKKSKRQKKRLKDKKKKEMMKQQGEGSTPNDTAKPNEASHSNGSETDDENASKQQPPSQQQQNTSKSKNGGVPHAKPKPDGPAVEEGAETRAPTSSSKTSKVQNSLLSTLENGKGDHQVEKIAEKLLVDAESEEQVNQEYVDFLMESGSILALSKKMDMESEIEEDLSDLALVSQ